MIPNNIVSKINIIGAIMMIYLAFRNLSETFFLHDTMFLNAITLLFSLMYFISSIVSLIRRMRIVPKENLDAIVFALVMIFSLELTNITLY